MPKRPEAPRFPLPATVIVGSRIQLSLDWWDETGQATLRPSSQRFLNSQVLTEEPLRRVVWLRNTPWVRRLLGCQPDKLLDQLEELK